MKTIKILLPLFLFSFGGQILAQSSSMPAPGVPKDFSLPEIKTFDLDNGLSVTLVPFGNLPKATVSLVVRSGNLNESENEVWLADFTGNMMKEGTASRSTQQIADEAASMGGSLSISTGPEITAISGDVLGEFAPRLAELIADVAINPVFPESETERLKNDLVRDLSIQRSQPENIAYELFSKMMYPGHPFGRIFPEQPGIESFTAAKAKAFHAENFGALRSHIYVAGVFDISEVEQAIRDAFGSWIKGSEPLINIPSKPGNHKIYFSDRPGAPQSVLNIGIAVPDPTAEDYIPLQLTNSMLGGSFTSRITRNIREDKGYTYSPYSRVISRYRTALWMQYAEVETSVTIPSMREIMYEVEKLTNEPVSNAELMGAKNYMTGIFILSNSTNSGIISQLAFLDLHGLERDWLNNYISNIRAVTTEDVQRVMKTYFNPGNMTIVVAGDRKRVGPGISKFGKVAD